MGQKPADIEQEIAERRRAITARIDRIDSRVRTDINDIKAKVPEPAEVGDSATNALSAPDRYLREHPMAAVGAAFASGVALDRMFRPDEDMRENGHRTEYRSRQDAKKRGLLGTVVSAVPTPVPGKAQDAIASALENLADVLSTEAKSLVREATTSLRNELFSSKPDRGPVEEAMPGDPAVLSPAQGEPVFSGANGQAQRAYAETGGHRR